LRRRSIECIPTNNSAKVARIFGNLGCLQPNAPRYQKERENLVRARAQSQLAIASVLPNLSAQGSYTRQFVTEAVTFGTTTFDTPVPNVYGGGATMSPA
jgi:hypothetical protein